MPSELLVCNGATCMCTESLYDTPSTLTVTSQTIMKINNLAVATADDCAVANFTAFGTCLQLTTNAGTGAAVACVPVLAAPWAGTSTNVRVNGVAAVTATSTLRCTVGGTISIENANNTKASGTS